MNTVVSLSDVQQAKNRIRGHVHETPVLTSETFNQLCGSSVWFKCENFQKVGAFKSRGALNAISQLSSSEFEVVTHSSGNHGAALAWAASKTARKATVICPVDASPQKREAIVRYGGTIVDCGSNIESREQTLHQFLEVHSAIFIPPYDDTEIIAGQGTAALEFLEQTSGLDEIWVPIGGGGLCAGTIVGANGCRVVGSEPDLARDAYESIQKGAIQPAYPPKTVADGLRSGIGELNFQIMVDHGLEVHLVSEAEILQAMRLVWQLLKIVIEPSSAVPVAALLKASPKNRRMGVILSGGNYLPTVLR